MSRVLVLGGGPAGLYAALLLSRRGLPVTLAERSSRLGGLAASFEVAGVRVDHGSHRLHPSIDEAILSDLRSLLGDELQLRQRRGRIRLAGRWLEFPLRATDLVSSLPPPAALRLAGGGLRAMITPSRVGTFEEAVTTRLGEPMGELFYFPYARKIWGLDPGELSGEQARRRISASSPLELVGRALSRDPLRRSFLYPAGGFGRIPEALGEAARHEGAEVRLGLEVVRLAQTNGHWGATLANGETLDAQVVLSTIPAAVLARLLGPQPEVGERLGLLRARSMLLVYLVVSAPRWTDYDAHYFPEEDTVMTRVSEPKAYRDWAGDPTDRTVLCAEIPCDQGDGLWTADDQGLIERVRAELSSMGLPDPGTRGEVRRLSNAYPVYRIGADSAFEDVERWLASFPGLLTFGRQGLFAHDNTHHALAMAKEAAGAVRPDLGVDLAAWIEARERFRTHVVED